MGISCDSIYSHAAWAKSLGGVSFPLLSDVHRDVVRRYGLFWPELNAGHRATVVVDRTGTIRMFDRHERGALPDPVKVLAEVRRLS